MLPLSAAEQIDQNGAKQGDLPAAQPGAAGRVEGVQSVGHCPATGAVGWELEGWEVST